MKKKALAILLSLAVGVGSCANFFAADFEVDKVEIIENEYEEECDGEEENISFDDTETGEEFSITDETDSEIDSDDLEQNYALEDDAEIDTELPEEASAETPSMNYMVVEPEEPFENPEFDESATFSDLSDYVADKYITPHLPKLRRQDPYGACWAFSTMALAEINLMMKGVSDETVDFSELHLVYFTYNSVVDPLGGTAEDSNRMTHDNMSSSEIASEFMERGGNLIFSQNVLASWTGAADESLAPYSTASDVIARYKETGTGLSESLAFKDAAHLTAYYNAKMPAYYLPGKDGSGKTTGYINSEFGDGFAAIKKLIVDNGAVGISYNGNKTYNNSQGVRIYCYNSDNNAFYHPDYSTQNHAVTVVGWDDNFPASNFNETPPGDGAWLVRNSWYKEGEDEFEYNGYFWLSYYDGSLSDAAYSFVFEPGFNYEHNYQYDGAMYTAYRTGKKAANVFTVNGDGEAESLKAVSFVTRKPNDCYTIEIYKNLTDDTNPVSGRLAATVTGKTEYQGYHTVVLDNPVYLNEGTKFSVVISLTDSEGNADSYAVEKAYKGWVNITTGAQKGQSFIYTGSKWSDLGSSINANLRIKAFTDNTEYVEEKPVQVIRILDNSAVPKWYASSDGRSEQHLYGEDGPVLEYGPDEASGIYSITAGNTLTLKADFLPKENLNGLALNVFWGSDNSSIVSVDDSGKLTALSSGTTRVYAQNKDYDLETSFMVSVVDAAESIILNKTSYKMGVGSKVKLSATVLPYSADQQVLFSVQEGKESILSVSEDGTVTALSGGTAYVLAKTADGKKSAKCSITVGQNYDDIIISGSGNKDIVAVGKTLQLSASYVEGGSVVNPINKNITWEIPEDYQEFAYISSKGLLTGVKEGIVVVRAAGQEGEPVSEKVFYIYVPVAKAELMDKAVTLSPGKTYQLGAKITPSVTGANYFDTATGDDIWSDVSQQIKWSLKNPEDSEYLYVEEDTGLITSFGDSPGRAIPVQARITPFMAKEILLTCNVTIAEKYLTKLTLSASKTRLSAGDSTFVTPKFSPTVPLEEGIDWEIISGEEYISLKDEIDNKLLIVANENAPKGAVIKIKATTFGTNKSNKNLTATCSITVVNPVKSIAILKGGKEITEPLALQKGKSATIKSRVYADSGKTVLSGNQKVYYSSSDTRVATVSSAGKVTAVGNGQVIITARSAENNEVTEAISIEVFTPVSKLNLDKTKVKLSLDNNGKETGYEVIKPILSPSDVSESKSSITWTVNTTGKIEWGAIPSDTADIVITNLRLNNSSEDVEFFPAYKGVSFTTHKDEVLAIKGTSPGQIKLSATEPGGKKKTVTVTVYTFVDKLELKESSDLIRSKEDLSHYSAEIKLKKTLKVKPMVSFFGAPYSDGKKTVEERSATAIYDNAKKYSPSSAVYYESSDISVAAVNSSGKITAKGRGSATIRVITKDGGYINTIDVTVY